jgi:hypothetical protein
MAVYGPAQDEFESNFLAELVRACQQNHLPTIVGRLQQYVWHLITRNYKGTKTVSSARSDNYLLVVMAM